MITTLITLLIVIAILGILAWAANLLPIPQPFAQFIQIILIIAAVVYVLGFLLHLAGAPNLYFK